MALATLHFGSALLLVGFHGNCVSYLVSLATDGVTMVASSECAVSGVSESEAREVGEREICICFVTVMFSAVSADSAGGERRGGRGRRGR